MPLDPAVADRIASRLARRKPQRVFRLTSGLGASSLALAAAALLYVGIARRGGAELPEYAVAARGVAMERGPTEPTRRLRLSADPSARFEVVLRPQTAPGAAVSAWAFTSGVELAPLDATVDVSSAGAVRITGSAASLGSAREIVTVVAPPSMVGSAADAARYAGTRTRTAKVRILVVPIDR
jgi:hypothetical protein